MCEVGNKAIFFEVAKLLNTNVHCKCFLHAGWAPCYAECALLIFSNSLSPPLQTNIASVQVYIKYLGEAICFNFRYSLQPSEINDDFICLYYFL